MWIWFIRPLIGYQVVRELRAIAENLIDSFDEHLANFFLLQPLTDLVIQEAAALLDRRTLRAYDAVQLAGCVMLRARLGRHATFVCSDRQLVKAAEDEGMTVLDPSVEA